jgi:hypothetical protein
MVCIGMKFLVLKTENVFVVFLSLLTILAMFIYARNKKDNYRLPMARVHGLESYEQDCLRPSLLA